MRFFILILLVVIPLLACSKTDDRPAVWGYISPAIIQPNCATASCHGPASAVAGLDFSDAHMGYTSLTRLWVWIVDPKGTAAQGCKRVDGTIVCQRLRRPLVTPYDPSQSRLVNMLRARGAPRMPPDRPLPETDIRLIEQWILDGAPGPRGLLDAATVDTKSDGAGDGAGSEAGDKGGESGETGDGAGKDGAGEATSG